jgi:hypothetical protein
MDLTCPRAAQQIRRKAAFVFPVRFVDNIFDSANEK